MNTLQRIEAYKFVIKELEEDAHVNHLCPELYIYARRKEFITLNKYLSKQVKYDWPELYQQKPAHVKSGEAWFPFGDVESRKTAIKNSISLAETTLYHEIVKTAVNELGLETLPIPMNDTAKVLLHMITCNGVTCKDSVKSGYRARIANILHDHNLKDMIGKETLYDKNEYGNDYYYMRHYVKPEHVEAVVLAYLRINCPKEVKARKLQVLEEVQDCGV